MRPEKCPSCGGYCCTGNLFGNKVRHTAEWGFEHECLRCPDGYTPTPKPPERTADTERAAIVLWLRAEAARLRKAEFVGSRAYVLESTAYMIENGVHADQKEKA